MTIRNPTLRRILRVHGYEHLYQTDAVFKATVTMIERVVENVAHELRVEEVDPEVVTRVLDRVIHDAFPPDLEAIRARMSEAMPLADRPPGDYRIIRDGDVRSLSLDREPNAFGGTLSAYQRERVREAEVRGEPLGL